MSDLSKVLDWAIANTATDPARIGTAGISYGGGLSLLGAAFDPRIRTVAVLSGWTDLPYSLYADSTRHRQSAALLKIAADLLGNPGPELSGKLNDFAANRNADQILAWSQVRSAETYLDALNANRPAVMIANGWGDSIFPPNQLVDFYERYTGPKRLELRPGDHAIAELTGILGLDNDVWNSVYRWFDQHLAGIDNGVATESSGHGEALQRRRRAVRGLAGPRLDEHPVRARPHPRLGRHRPARRRAGGGLEQDHPDGPQHQRRRRHRPAHQRHRRPDR
nr:hypothetical protein GCM10020092_064750 [Actinoplanes digitatis]